MATATTLIHRSTGTQGQNASLRSLHEAAGRRIRVNVRVDTCYKYQSRPLKAEVWIKGRGWTEVADLHWAEAKSGERGMLENERVLLERALWTLELGPQPGA